MRVVVGTAFALALVAVAVRAQAPVPAPDSLARWRLRLGDTVQVRALVSVATSGLTQRMTCIGIVGALRRDTIYMSRSDECPPRHIARDEIQTLRVMRGNSGSRLAHTGAGMLIGMLAGGVAGRLFAGDGCATHPCDDGGLAVGLLTIAGGLLGTVTGGLFGLAMDAGPQWQEAYERPVIRVTQALENTYPESRIWVSGRRLPVPGH